MYEFEDNDTRISQVNTHRSAYTPSQRNTGLSVLILNLEKPELMGPLLEMLKRSTSAFQKQGLKLEILVGDTGSKSKEIRAIYDSHKSHIQLFENLEYNFSRNNNFLCRHTSCSDLLFLNNDVILPNETTLFEFYKSLKANNGAPTGATLLYPNGAIQHSGISFVGWGPQHGLPFDPLTHEKSSALDFHSKTSPAVTGAMLGISYELFCKLGMFDELFKSECQDVALCLKAHRIGIPSYVVNLGSIVHIENATRPKGEINLFDRARFLRKWYSYIQLNFLKKVEPA